MIGTLAAVSVCARVSKGADFRRFGEVAEWFKAAVLKTAPENMAQPQKSSDSAEILAAATAFTACSRRTSRHARRHRTSVGE
jgi:hypothetical protein